LSALAWGRLLRLSLAPSAAADVAAGATLAAGGVLPSGGAPWLVMLASLSVYTGSLALNDWADREHDARTRPDRPIPSGAVRPRAALALSAALQVGAVALAFGAGTGPGLFVLAIACLATTYNLAGRGAWTGPLLLGACRAANLTAGMAVALPGSPPRGALAVAALYGLYVFLASRLGRMEDAEDGAPIGPRATRLVLSCAAVFALLPLLPRLGLEGLPRQVGVLPATVVATVSAAGLVLHGLRLASPTRADVERTMGVLLRRLLVFTATVALMATPFHRPQGADAWHDGWFVALAILAGYPVSFALRRAFPPS